ncbi:MAG: polymer-forming cytoskeletal protein [bacterium]
MVEAGAVMVGDVSTRLVVADGAHFKGRVQMDFEVPALDAPRAATRRVARPDRWQADRPEARTMANTVIGGSMTVDGEISGAESLVVQGQVKGRIGISENLYVENSATVEADIRGRFGGGRGRVTGNVTASTRVEIKAEGRMVGDVRSPRILIADGALFKGSIDMDVERDHGEQGRYRHRGRHRRRRSHRRC